MDWQWKSEEAARSFKATRPVFFFHVGNHDAAGLAAGRMDEAMLAQINADMRKRALHGAEKYQIAWTQILLIYAFARLADLISTTR